MLDFKIISQFFDAPAVMKKVKDGTKSVLSKAGAFVRTTARNSIRKRKRSARAGEPPSSHTGLLKKFIYFAYDFASEMVVVGPVGFRRKAPTVTELLEFGGEIDSHWRDNKPATYDKFPYMEPALEKEAPKFPELFTNAIK